MIIPSLALWVINNIATRKIWFQINQVINMWVRYCVILSSKMFLFNILVASSSMFKIMILNNLVINMWARFFIILNRNIFTFLYMLIRQEFSRIAVGSLWLDLVISRDLPLSLGSGSLWALPLSIGTLSLTTLQTTQRLPKTQSCFGGANEAPCVDRIPLKRSKRFTRAPRKPQKCSMKAPFSIILIHVELYEVFRFSWELLWVLGIIIWSWWSICRALYKRIINERGS